MLGEEVVSERFLGQLRLFRCFAGRLDREGAADEPVSHEDVRPGIPINGGAGRITPRNAGRPGRHEQGGGKEDQGADEADGFHLLNLLVKTDGQRTSRPQKPGVARNVPGPLVPASRI